MATKKEASKPVIPLGASVSLWRLDEEVRRENSPIYVGKIQIKTEDGEYEVVADISLWPGKSDNPKAPRLTGIIKEPYQKEEKQSESGNYF